MMEKRKQTRDNQGGSAMSNRAMTLPDYDFRDAILSTNRMIVDRYKAGDTSSCVVKTDSRIPALSLEQMEKIVQAISGPSAEGDE